MVGLEGFSESIYHSLGRPVIRHSDEGTIPETLGGQTFRMRGDGSDPVIDPHPIPERDLPAAPAGHAKNSSLLTGDECRIKGSDGSANRSVPQLTHRRMHRPIILLHKTRRSDSFEESLRAGSHIEVGAQRTSAIEQRKMVSVSGDGFPSSSVTGFLSITSTSPASAPSHSPSNGSHGPTLIRVENSFMKRIVRWAMSSGVSLRRAQHAYTEISSRS